MNIIITGASAGIGREVALCLAGDKKNKIVALSRNKTALLSLAEASENKNIIIMDIDLRLTLDVRKRLKNIISEQLGSVDILINNAGLLINKPFGELKDSEVEDLISVNFQAPLLIMQALLPYMKSGSHVVNIGSMGGFQGSSKFNGLSVYSSAKGALAILTECLAAEYAEQGISFNCLALGSVSTDMLKKAFPGYSGSMTPGEIARFVSEFAINGNKYFNGKVIPVAKSIP
jgi:NAD(P)-dependent dehydrogenase (short-subunit alcohol dehydrogenase family)